VPSEEQKPKQRQSQQFCSQCPGDFDLQIPLPHIDVPLARTDEMLIFVHECSDSAQKLRHSACLRKLAAEFAGVPEVKYHAQLVHNRTHD
jgi:hypothetical protein